MDGNAGGNEILDIGVFEDIAAAVGEGGSGSDDDATSDDFLSWLLVLGDTIDPKLDVDEASLLAGNSANIDTTNSTINSTIESVKSAVEEDKPENAVAVSTDADGIETIPPPAVPVPSSLFSALVGEPNGVLAQVHPVLGVGAAPAAADVLPVGSSITSGKLSKATAAPPTVGNWGTVAGAGGAAVQVGAPVGGVVGGIEGGASLESQLAAGAIPSDPVLAMQMGARMALSGKLNLLPFAMGAAGIVSDAQNPLRPQEPTPSTISAAHPTAAPAAAVELPILARHPPPPWVKIEGTAPTAMHTTNSSPLSGGSVGLGKAIGGGAAGTWAVATHSEGIAAPVEGHGSYGFVGVAEKRPRSSSNLGGAGVKVAADGRRRKRMSIAELEERVRKATEDNKRLKLHLVNVNDKLELMATRKKQMETEIAAKLEGQRSQPSDLNNAQLADALARFKDLYADYGAQRKMEVEFHLKQLERQIVPTDTTKMSLWTLDQDPSFFKDRKRGGLSQILHNELGVSEEQIARIQERRARIKSLLAELRESLRLVRELQQSSEAKNAKFEEVMARLQSSFSPQQIARLILWVSANRAHISKLPLLPRKFTPSSTSPGGVGIAG